MVRHEQSWPLERTEWTRFYLDADAGELNTEAPSSAASVAYDTTGDGASFTLGPLAEQAEITGPLAAKLFVESSTADADLFLVVRVFPRTARRSSSTARWTRTPRWHRAGCGPRIGSSTTS